MGISDEEFRSVDTLLEEGLILYGTGDFGGAAKIWEKALELDPDNAQALEYLDIVREDLSGPLPAEKAAEKTTPPESPIPAETSYIPPTAEIVSKGLALLENGSFEEAYEAFREAVSAGEKNPDIFGYLEMTRAARLDRYKAILPDPDKIPRIAIDYEAIKKLNLGKEEGFMLSQIDGLISFKEILSLMRMEKLDAMGILIQLLSTGVIKTD